MADGLTWRAVIREMAPCRDDWFPDHLNAIILYEALDYHQWTGFRSTVDTLWVSYGLLVMKGAESQYSGIQRL
jgi:hypothetical protein